jgi:hypothetical protein
MIATKYLLNLAKRAATDGHVEPVEIANLPKLIDKVYGDGDGQLEISDVVDAATEIGGELVDKATHLLEFIGHIF